LVAIKNDLGAVKSMFWSGWRYVRA